MYLKFQFPHFLSFAFLLLLFGFLFGLCSRVRIELFGADSSNRIGNRDLLDSLERRMLFGEIVFTHFTFSRLMSLTPLKKSSSEGVDMYARPTIC